MLRGSRRLPHMLLLLLLPALLVLPGRAAAFSGVSHSALAYPGGHVDVFVAGRQCAIVLEGLLDNDAVRVLDAGFRQMQKQGCSEGTMQFNSGGGSPAAAYLIGDFLSRHKFDTVIAGGALCFSACAYAFLGGHRRHIAAQGRFGVHQHSRESVCLPELSDAEDKRMLAILQRALPAPAVARLQQMIRDTDCATMNILPRADIDALVIANHAAPLPAPVLREAVAEREAQVFGQFRKEATGPWTRHAGDKVLTVYSRAIPEQKPGRLQRLWALVSYNADHSETAASAAHRSQLLLNEIDCERKTISIVRGIYTRDAMGEGAVTWKTGRLTAQAVQPGTPAAIWYRVACGQPLPV